MYEIMVLKVEDPSCFWGTIVKGSGVILDDTSEYAQLYDEMNWLYTFAFRDVEEIKPSALEEGQVCMAYCQELKCWCRAVVESFISSADGYLAECFLVDHAKYIPVKTKSIRAAVETCLRLPFRAKKFKLSHIQPVTLHIDFCKDTAELGPAKRWDSAAIQYFQSLLKASTCIEVKVCSKEDDCYEVYLYVTTQEEKICLNDELVTKNFARFVVFPETETISPTRTTTANHVENLLIASDSVTPPRDKIKEMKNPVLALWPTLHGKVFKRLTSDFMLEETILEMQKESNFFMNEIQLERQAHEKTDDAKLLQILNPGPLKAADVLSLEQLQKINFNAQRHNIFLSKKMEPCLTLEQAPLSADLKKELIRNEILGPNLTEAYCWPSVAQGNDSVVISPHGKDPIIYIPPVLTYLQLASVAHKTVPCRNGPLVLFLCPGWKKAHHVFELLRLYGKSSKPLSPILLFVGANKEEAKNVKLPRGCEVIVTTPNSLLRLLEYQSLLFVRLCHIILDEVELLCSEAGEQLLTILDLYKKNVVETRKTTPQQIVAVGTRWHKHLEILIKEFMNEPHLIIANMEEAAVYGNVQQVVHLCLHYDKPSTLIRMLDFTPMDAEKILIFTNSVEETEMIYKVVASNSVYCLKMHAKLHFHLNYVAEQWERKISSGTCVVLVLTDDCIPSLHITDATCVIHYDFPASHQIFGLRMFTMSGNFQNKLQKGFPLEPGTSKAKSILLLTEKNACQAIGVLHYLEHTEAKIPQELYDFTAGILKANEDAKLEKPLCRYLKEFGACRGIRTCPERHQINGKTDVPQNVSGKTIPTNGSYISIIPLHIVSAANYYGRIIANDDLYASLAAEMGDYYQKASNRICVEKVEKLALYGLQEGALYYRVQVLKVFQKEDGLFFTVNVSYIDEGRTGDIRGHQLLQLPLKFHHLPPQAVEFIVARVKPIDNETSWNPKVTRHICQKIRGKQHDAKVTLSLGNTVWIDPMVRVMKLTDLKTSINEYNVRTEILSTGMGIDNPEHMEQLKALCREAHLLPDESSTLQTTMQNFTSDTIKVNPANEYAVSEPVSENKVYEKAEVPESQRAAIIKQPTLKSFHPQIKWFQKEDTLTLMIKIRNVTDHNSSFFLDRVTFSAHSGDKYYLADLELSGKILAKKSLCEIKQGEPVLILTKAEKGTWNSLLKQKNPNVCFDFEHWEDSEDGGQFPIGNSCVKNNYRVDNEDLEDFLGSSNSRGSDSESD